MRASILKIPNLDGYQIAFDEAAFLVPGGTKDPWYWVIACKHGQIYSYSDKLLAIHAKGLGARRKLSQMKGLTTHNWSDDGEAIFIFPLALFDRVAKIVKPKRKRQLSEDQRKQAIDRLRAFQFKPKTTHVKAQKRAKKGPIADQGISEAG